MYLSTVRDVIVIVHPYFLLIFFISTKLFPKCVKINKTKKQTWNSLLDFQVIIIRQPCDRKVATRKTGPSNPLEGRSKVSDCRCTYSSGWVLQRAFRLALSSTTLSSSSSWVSSRSMTCLSCEWQRSVTRIISIPNFFFALLNYNVNFPFLKSKYSSCCNSYFKSVCSAWLTSKPNRRKRWPGRAQIVG